VSPKDRRVTKVSQRVLVVFVLRAHTSSCFAGGGVDSNGWERLRGLGPSLMAARWEPQVQYIFAVLLHIDVEIY
jgi:hypothetical protein